MIEITTLEIDNFKSLEKFRIDLGKFTSLIGLNGAGKSTILQAIDFVSQQMHGRIYQWVHGDRKWDAKGLKSKFNNRQTIDAKISYIYHSKLYIWEFKFNTVLLKCTYENIKMASGKSIFEVKDAKYMIVKDLETQAKALKGDIIQEYEGSFLSSLKDDFLPDSIRTLKYYLQNIYSLELLSPQELRKPSLVGNSKLGRTGANLSAYLSTFNSQQHDEILKQLRKCYPQLENYKIKKITDVLTQLEVIENFREKQIISEATYLNDGILRLIAILAQLQSQKSFLLFDEIENGINAELIEFLMDTLIASKHQVMITTHSPMILNYIEDEVAKESVQYIYKTKEGFTQSIPLFNIPSMSEKLELMGAGEVYMDTDLSLLAEEIESLQVKKEK